MKQKIILSLTVGSLVLGGATIQAEQSGMGHYMSGQQADFSTTVPTHSGWTFANYFLDYNDATFNASKALPFGNVLAAGVTVNMQADVPAAFYAYPFKFLGGTLASGVLVPFVWVDVKATATFDNDHNPLTGTRQDATSGLGDIEIMPLMAGWTNGDFKFDGMFNIWAPSGTYEKGQLANPGMGYWTFEPMVAISWLSTKIGTEVSVYTAVDFNTENTDANYQSGDIFHVDATVAQHLPLFGGFAGVGATAFYRKQITGDSGSGARLGSFETETYGVGPTISYAHPIGKSILIFDGSWLPQTYAANTFKGDYFWAKLTLSF
jgi:hypothetical protein